MKKTPSHLAFIDLLFNLLLGITVMFIVSFLLINPPKDDGKIDPPAEMLITMSWDPDSKVDIDLWVRGYDGAWVGFKRKDVGYMSLERDDRGQYSEIIEVNGVKKIIKRNYEVVTLRALPPGEYIVNVHYWTFPSDHPETIKIDIVKLNPRLKSIYSGEVILNPDEEKTAVSFVIDENKNITDINTEVQVEHVWTKENIHNTFGRDRL